MQNSIVVELCCTIRANSSLTFAAGFRRQHGRAGDCFVLHEGVDDDVGNDGQQQHRLKAQELAAEVERLQRRLSPNIIHIIIAMLVDLENVLATPLLVCNVPEVPFEAGANHTRP